MFWMHIVWQLEDSSCHRPLIHNTIIHPICIFWISWRSYIYDSSLLFSFGLPRNLNTVDNWRCPQNPNSFQSPTILSFQLQFERIHWNNSVIREDSTAITRNRTVTEQRINRYQPITTFVNIRRNSRINCNSTHRQFSKLQIASIVNSKHTTHQKLKQ